MFDMQKVLKQAQEMQSKMQGIQDEMARIEFTGAAGGGAVKIVATGKYEFRSVKISADVVGDAAMLEDLILTALNDVSNQLADTTREKMKGVTDGLNIPGLKLPF